MEERLRPINAVLGLASHHDINPTVLADAGFRFVGLEVPVTTDLGTVVVDLVLHQPETGLLVACEAKSGRNVEVDQARRYTRLLPTNLVDAAKVTLKHRSAPQVTVVYLCLACHMVTVRQGLDALGIDFPVIGVDDQKIIFDCRARQPEPLGSILDMQQVVLGAPPSRIIPFDQDSLVDVIEPYVKAQLVVALSHQRQQVTLRMLAEQTAPHFALYGARAKHQLVKKVGRAVANIAAVDGATFEYVSPRPNDDGVVRLLRTPEDNDPRGRTQAYQALSRMPRPKRRSLKVDPNQLDLLREVDQADDEGVDEGTDGEEMT